MNTNPSISPSTSRLLSIRDVTDQTSLSRPTIYRLIGNGQFPRQIRLSKNRVAWKESDVENWKQNAALESSA